MIKTHIREIIIQLNTISPIDFFGVNHQRLDLIKQKYPTVKILSRGTQLKITGNESIVNVLKKKIDYIILQLERKQFVPNDEFADIFDVDYSISAVTKDVAKSEENPHLIIQIPNGKSISAVTKGQQSMVSYLEKNDILFAVGPAGTGKTYTAVALAIHRLKTKAIKKIILTRPAVEAGESLGYLPGALKEKVDPYLRPLYDALQDMLPLERLTHYMNTNIIEVAPLAYMRGRTLNNAFLILDEAQNATEAQLKMFLTRIGPNAKVIITGDLSQIDLPKNQTSGLSKVIDKLKSIKGIKTIVLDGKDILRHKLIIHIIRALGGK